MIKQFFFHELTFFCEVIIMGISIPHGPINWRPRAILKNREINDLDFATCQLKLLVLRAETELDWDDIQRDIWVRFLILKSVP